MNLYQMEDAKTDRVVFVGTEKECLEFSKNNPDIKYNMIEVKEGEKKC